MQSQESQTLSLPTHLTPQHFNPLPKHLSLSHDSLPPSSHTLLSKKQKLLIESHIPISSNIYYPQKFVKVFIIIKLNSLCKKQCRISQHFLQEFVKLYFCDDVVRKVWVCATEGQIMGQLLGKIGDNLGLEYQDIQNVLQGSCLMATSAYMLVHAAQKYLKKQQYVFCLSFIALGGRQNAFIPIVHKQKNHSGQIHFAQRISQLFHVNRKITKQQIKVQDPYSMRCSPQVHGIAYDCVQELRNMLQSVLNRCHCKYLYIGGKKMVNLLGEAEGVALKMDFVVGCLQEIGAMSLLRTQRMLNIYLGKNQVQSHPTHPLLFTTLQTCTILASQNKLLCEYSNFDTCNIHNYQKDIFYNPGQYYKKTYKLLQNLYYIMNIQILTSIQAMKDKEEGKIGTVQFINQEMRNWTKWIQERVSVMDRRESLRIVKEEWMV